MAKVTGRAFIKLGGDLVRSRPGATMNLGGITRTAVNGDNGVHGPKEEVSTPFIEMSISHTSDLDLQALHAFEGNITLETDTGSTYVLREAWSANPPEINIQEGTVAVRMEGIEAEPV